MGLATAAVSAMAQDWDGSFVIIPASAPEMVLEAVGAGVGDGTPVSLGDPSTKPGKEWIITPKGNGVHTIRPSYSETMVLSASGGNTDNGTPVVLETDVGKPSQLWSIRQNPDGSFAFVPQHAPTKGLDDFMGCKTIGAKLDIWDNNPSDEHLQWYVKPLPGAKCPSAAKLGPWNIPRGTVREFTFEDSKIFPGTRRSGAVFIPAQYDGSKPACVYVHQDGLGWPPEIRLLEKLMAAKEIPVTIGVYIMPGYLPPSTADTTGRLNRCLEYDGLGDKYVRFLTEELLPYVARKFDLKLSTSGNDRCISGGSSGGIAAFNAAWERPDAFSRVFACSGSFVAFRGGNQFPTMIRLFEPKPIRAFLTTGTDDMENRAGSWFLVDQEVDKALTFSGYDHLFYIINGGHGAGWAEHFLEAMRYLWKGWPEPVQPGPGAPHVRSIIIPDENWSVVTQDYKDACSPASNSKGEVFFIAPATNQICRIGLDGKVKVFIQNAAQANGLAVGPNDELYTVSRRSGTVMCYNRSGSEGHAIIEGIPGHDILARPDGSLYITCNEEKDGGGGTVWLVKDSRKTLVDSGLKHPTGLACRPDQWLLSVADGQSKWVYSYQIQPDGLLANKERYFHLQVADWDDDAGPESVCYANEGQMLVATRWGIQVCAGDGPTMAILPLPDSSRVTGLCLGGSEGDTLFAFAGDKVWKRKVRIHANGAFSPFNKVEGTPL